MLLRWFKSNQVIVQLLLPVIAAPLWFSQFYEAETALKSNSYFFNFYLDGLTTIWQKIWGIALLLGNALLLNQIINKNELFERTFFVPSFLYVMLISAEPGMVILSPDLISHFFILLAIRRLLNVHRQVVCKSEIFDAAIFLLLAALFYPAALILFLMVWVVLLINRPFIWREWAMPLLATLLFLIYLVVFFLGIADWKKIVVLVDFDTGNYRLPSSPFFYPALIILLIIFFLSILALRLKNRRSTIRFRKISAFLISFFLLAVIASVLCFLKKGHLPYYLLVLPLVFILSFYFFYNPKPKIERLFFWCIIVTVYALAWS